METEIKCNICGKVMGKVESESCISKGNVLIFGKGMVFTPAIACYEIPKSKSFIPFCSRACEFKYLDTE
jgi:hypothetical protein